MCLCVPSRLSFAGFWNAWGAGAYDICGACLGAGFGRLREEKTWILVTAGGDGRAECEGGVPPIGRVWRERKSIVSGSSQFLDEPRKSNTIFSRPDTRDTRDTRLGSLQNKMIMLRTHGSTSEGTATDWCCSRRSSCTNRGGRSAIRGQSAHGRRLLRVVYKSFIANIESVDRSLHSCTPVDAGVHLLIVLLLCYFWLRIFSSTCSNKNERVAENNRIVPDKSNPTSKEPVAMNPTTLSNVAARAALKLGDGNVRTNLTSRMNQSIAIEQKRRTGCSTGCSGHGGAVMVRHLLNLQKIVRGTKIPKSFESPSIAAWYGFSGGGKRLLYLLCIYWGDKRKRNGDWNEESRLWEAPKVKRTDAWNTGPNYFLDKYYCLGISCGISHGTLIHEFYAGSASSLFAESDSSSSSSIISNVYRLLKETAGLQLIERSFSSLTGNSSVQEESESDNCTCEAVAGRIFKNLVVLLVTTETFGVTVCAMGRKNGRKKSGMNDTGRTGAAGGKTKDKEAFPHIPEPEMDWDNFFPYVEFCDSGDEEEQLTKEDVTAEGEETNGRRLERIPTDDSSSSGTASSNDQRNTNIGKCGGESLTVSEALCVPYELSPPPKIDSISNTATKKPRTMIGSLQKKITKMRGDNGETGSRAEDEDERDDRSETSMESAVSNQDDGSEEEIVSSSSRYVGTHHQVKRSRRCRSLDDRRDLNTCPQQFSIADMVAEADEKDFLIPRGRRMSCKFNADRVGPMLSSTIGDDDEEEPDSPDSRQGQRLRGGGTKSKTDSLKDSFKKRSEIRGEEANREKTMSERKAKRKDLHNSHRNIQRNQSAASSPISSEHGREQIGANDEMECDQSMEKSPIIGGRRGKQTRSWADISIRSDFSLRSDGNSTLGARRRKTRRGKRKKRNLSISNLNVSTSESFKATLENRSFNMSGIGDHQFSGTLRSRSDGSQGGENPPRRGENAGGELACAARQLDRAESGPSGEGNGSKEIWKTTSTPKRNAPCPVLSRISDLVRAGNPYERGDGAMDLDDSRVIECEEAYSVQRVRADHPPALDRSQEIDVNSLLPNNCRKIKGGRKIKTNGVIQFVILRRPDGSSEEWDFFSKKKLEDLINTVECKNASDGNGLSAVFKFANMWGVIPLLGLYSFDLSLLHGYRYQIELFSDGYEYQTFPREALDKRLSLTMMLWQNLEGLKIPAIAPNLLDRNPGLEGGVKVARVKNFRAIDKDVRGESMLGARLAQLDGNETFLKSLEKFPRSHRFGLGVGSIIIRGGERAPEPEGSTWGRNRQTNKKPSTYSEAASTGVRNADMNISASSLNAYATQASGVMEEAEASIRGRAAYNKSRK